MNPAEHPDRNPSRISLFQHAAESIFHIQFDPDTVSRWQDTIHLTLEIDHLLDTSRVKSVDETEALLANYVSEENLQVYPSLSKENNEKFLEYCDIAKCILHLNRHLKQVESYERYIKLRQLEGRLYANLLLSCCSESVRMQENYMKFTNDFTKLGEAGILFDTLMDASQDFKRGEIQVDFTKREWLHTLGRAACITKGISVNILKPRSIITLSATAAKIAYDRYKGST